MNKFLCFILLLLLLSCSSEKPSQPPGPPVSPEIGHYSLQITPQNPTRNSTLYLIAQGFNLSDARIEWLVNDRITSNPTVSQFNASEIKKGDKVQAKAIIQGIEIFSNIVQIKNSPPVISKLKILPEVFKPGDTLSVEVSGSDIDGDEIAISYEWTKNGEPAGNNKRIEAQLKRGDKVDVKITPFDGEAYGHSVILHREIVNLPPMIIEDTKYNFDGKMYTYQVKATDPDGDPLTYSLKVAPASMTINSSTGLIQWNVPQDFKGKTPITISVTDSHGGEASRSFTFEIISPHP
ncbi:MAG: putative Ig domain-containing protein [Nitrospirota bacterium]